MSLAGEFRLHDLAVEHFGYLFAILLMALVCGGLYLAFKRRNWL
ncbi:MULTISPECIES: hypothetical protein [Micromonospora]|nr:MULTISPECIES: hypothetical protein [Micromonospora]